MPREAIPSYYFSLVVVRKGDEFLLVHECKHGQLWYLPAGRVEPGEAFVAAAERETLEEAGIRVRVSGIIRVEHTPLPAYTRVRVVFMAEPLDDAPPKQTPDKESLGAAWVRRDDLDRYPLRGSEVRELMDYIENGGPVYPLSLLQLEGAGNRV